MASELENIKAQLEILTEQLDGLNQKWITTNNTVKELNNDYKEIVKGHEDTLNTIIEQKVEPVDKVKIILEEKLKNIDKLVDDAAKNSSGGTNGIPEKDLDNFIKKIKQLAIEEIQRDYTPKLAATTKQKAQISKYFKPFAFLFLVLLLLLEQFGIVSFSSIGSAASEDRNKTAQSINEPPHNSAKNTINEFWCTSPTGYKKMNESVTLPVSAEVGKIHFTYKNQSCFYIKK